MTGLLEETDLLKGHKDRVWDIAWDRKGEVLASCSTDKTIRVWRQEGRFNKRALSCLGLVSTFRNTNCCFPTT